MRNLTSVNHYVCGDDVPFPDFAAAAATAGIAAVGVTRAAIAEMGVAGLKSCLDDHGLRVSSVNSAGYFTDPDATARMDESLALIDAAATLDANTLCVILGGAGSLPVAEARARAADGFAALAERAETASVTLGLEPIFPADVLTKGVVNSCAQALDFVAPFPAAKLILDLYHSWWDPDLVDTVRNRVDRVALIQLCNVRIADGIPVGRDVLPRGVLDFSTLLPALLSGGYAGPLELELFPRDRLGRPPLDLVREFPAHLDAASGNPS